MSILDLKRTLTVFHDAMARASNSVQSVLQKMEQAAHGKSKVHDPKFQQVCAVRAVKEISPLVRTMLLRNLDKAKIHDHTNKLRKAVEGAFIGYRFDLNKPWRLFVLFPRDVEPYVSKNGTVSNPYMVFAAVGHGRVNTRHGAHQYFSPALKAKQARQLRNKKLKALAKGKSSFMHDSSKFNITNPHPFFYLDGGQQATIQAAFMAAYHKNVAQG